MYTQCFVTCFYIVSLFCSMYLFPLLSPLLFLCYFFVYFAISLFQLPFSKLFLWLLSYSLVTCCLFPQLLLLFSDCFLKTVSGCLCLFLQSILCGSRLEVYLVFVSILGQLERKCLIYKQKVIQVSNRRQAYQERTMVQTAVVFVRDS